MPESTLPPRTAAERSPTEEIARARRLFELQRESWRRAPRTGARERIARLRALREGLLRSREGLYEAFSADFGKHRAEVDLTELHLVLGEIDHAIRHLRRWMRPQRVSTPLLLAGTRSEVRYEPKGVVLILAPWNYPLQLLVNPLVAAVAAGNRAIVRSSEKVPGVARVIGRILEEAFPEDEVATVYGEVEVADALLRLPFDHIFFTGSTAVGRKVMHAAAEHLAGVTLELGGKSPVIVHESAKVDEAAERIVWGKLINAGQTCVAPDYVLVPERLQEGFLRAAKASLAERYGRSEEERRAAASFPRLIDQGAVRRLSTLLDETVAAGARVVAGGRHDVEERYLAPTILADVPPDSPVMREEIFGPILPVLPYRTLEDALALVNSRPKPLALYVFARDGDVVERVLASTTAGGSAVNNVAIHLANPNLPFGGVGESGMGSYHGWFGFRTFSHERAVLVQRHPALLKLLFPPYGPRTERLLRWIERIL